MFCSNQLALQCLFRVCGNGYLLWLILLAIFVQSLFAIFVQNLFVLTCRDLEEKCGSGGGRHGKEGPDGQKLA